MEDYIKVNVNDYVNQGLENGELIPFQAEKFARIIARPGNIGEGVITWSVDSYGNPINEKDDTVKLDETTNQPSVVVTKADENGMPIVDQNGNLNQWIIEYPTFIKKYEIDSEIPNLFKPKGGQQTFVQINENIILNQWGSDMKIASGGFINITNPNDMYGISQRDFEDTYKICEDLERNTSVR